MPRKSPKRLDSEALWNYALRALSARAHSIAELREKLLQRAERAEDAASVLARLKQYGYLDDERFAETFSAARLENEGLGKFRVLHDLRKRRVAPRVAERAVERAYRDTDEIEMIEEFLRRKYRKEPIDQVLAEPKGLASAYRRLRAAGFRPGNILQVLRRLAREPGMLDALPEEDESEPGPAPPG